MLSESHTSSCLVDNTLWKWISFDTKRAVHCLFGYHYEGTLLGINWISKHRLHKELRLSKNPFELMGSPCPTGATKEWRAEDEVDFKADAQKHGCEQKDNGWLISSLVPYPPGLMKSLSERSQMPCYDQPRSQRFMAPRCRLMLNSVWKWHNLIWPMGFLPTSDEKDDSLHPGALWRSQCVCVHNIVC